MSERPIVEAQTYQSIGELAPEAERTLTTQKGWDGLAGSPPDAERPIDQLQAKDYSFWNRRANTQTLAGGADGNFAAEFFAPGAIPPMAGYTPSDGSYHQTPTAAAEPVAFDVEG